MVQDVSWKKKEYNDDDIIVVVGERFKNFNTNEIGVKVVGYEAAASIISKGGVQGAYFVPGQGLTEEAEQALFNLARKYKIADMFHVWEKYYTQKRAVQSVSHKHKKKNQKLTSPKKIDERRYISELLLDENSDMIADHDTGMHLQGMVLIESSRQMFIAVGEKYYAGKSAPKGGNYVIDHMYVDFVNFVFPLPVSIQLDVCTINRKSRRKTIFGTNVNFFQNNSCVANIRIGFTVMDSVMFGKTESKLAKNSLSGFRVAMRNFHKSTPHGSSFPVSEPHLENPYAEL